MYQLLRSYRYYYYYWLPQLAMDGLQFGN